MSDLTVGTAVAPEPGPGWARIFRPLAARDFRLLVSGETISLLGDQFHFVALAWLVLQMTGSGLAVTGRRGLGRAGPDARGVTLP